MTYPNWFAHYAQGYFEKHLAPLAGREGLRFLQIGVFTGDASLWLLENILTGPDSTLDDVDTWEGSEEPEHAAFDWAAVQSHYDERTKRYRTKKRLLKLVKNSSDFWRWTGGLWTYDFVYIDGDHTAPGVLADAVNGFASLRVGGLLAFDDYLWKPNDGSGETHAPALAIDAFAACYAEKVAVIDTGLQVWFQKVAA